MPRMRCRSSPSFRWKGPALPKPCLRQTSCMMTPDYGWASRERCGLFKLPHSALWHWLFLILTRLKGIERPAPPVGGWSARVVPWKPRVSLGSLTPILSPLAMAEPQCRGRGAAQPACRAVQHQQFAARYVAVLGCRSGSPLTPPVR